jgi:hypothetical protein
MTGGQHEPVAVGPRRRGRVVLEKPCIDRVCHRRHRHRQPRMAAVRGLDGLDREAADRVDRELVDRMRVEACSPIARDDGGHDSAPTSVGWRVPLELRAPSPPSATVAFAVTRW